MIIRQGLSVLLRILVLVTGSAFAPAAHAGFAHLILHSSPGSYIGEGKDWDITDTNASAICNLSRV